MIALWIILGLLALILVLMLIPAGLALHYHGEDFTADGLKINAVFNDGSKQELAPAGKGGAGKSGKKAGGKSRRKAKKGEEIRAAALYGLAAADQ